MSKKIFILDEIVPKTGMVATYRDAYLERYAPRARQRGMTLEYLLLTPPLIIEEGPNTLHFLWSVENTAAWWIMRVGGGGRPIDTSGSEKNQWWEQSRDMTVSRRRSILVDFIDAIDDPSCSSR